MKTRQDVWYDQDLNDVLPSILNLCQSSFWVEYICIASDMFQFTRCVLMYFVHSFNLVDMILKLHVPGCMLMYKS